MDRSDEPKSGELFTSFSGVASLSPARLGSSFSACGANRKRVRRLMRQMELESVAPKPGTTVLAKGHKVYPYLLKNLEITRPNQVWGADITYVPLARGVLYLMAILDWYSRYMVSWRLSNSLVVSNSRATAA